MSSDWINAVDRHLDRFWPNRTRKAYKFGKGPISRSVPDFSVIEIAPSAPDQAWLYLTSGGWSTSPRGGSHLEFMISSPAKEQAHIETLAMAANFNADPKYSCGVGTLLPIGRPWMEESRCDHLLVSIPYCVGPEAPAFEYLEFEKCWLRWLWLLPITKREYDYASKHGYSALEDLFEKAQINTVDVYRKSVV